MDATGAPPRPCHHAQPTATGRPSRPFTRFVLPIRDVLHVFTYFSPLLFSNRHSRNVQKQMTSLPMTRQGTLLFQHSASTSGPTRPPRPRCRIRSALRLRPSVEAPHGRATTTLRRGFVPVGAIAVGGCGSRAEPYFRARAPGKANFGVGCP